MNRWRVNYQVNDRLLSMLGLCRRAGKLTIGADPVVESVITQKAHLVIMASDFSKNSRKNILKACQNADVSLYEINRTRDELSFSLGKFCAVISITDKGFSDKIQEIILKEQEQEE